MQSTQILYDGHTSLYEHVAVLVVRVVRFFSVRKSDRLTGVCPLIAECEFVYDNRFLYRFAVHREGEIRFQLFLGFFDHDDGGHARIERVQRL